MIEPVGEHVAGPSGKNRDDRKIGQIAGRKQQ
jgi:hypothetical protein